MLSTGQIVFAICFIIAFVIIMIISYRKDKKLHRKQYKGTFWILLGFVVFVLILLAVKLALTD